MYSNLNYVPVPDWKAFSSTIPIYAAQSSMEYQCEVDILSSYLIWLTMPILHLVSVMLLYFAALGMIFAVLQQAAPLIVGRFLLCFRKKKKKWHNMTVKFTASSFGLFSLLTCIALNLTVHWSKFLKLHWLIFMCLIQPVLAMNSAYTSWVSTMFSGSLGFAPVILPAAAALGTLVLVLTSPNSSSQTTITVPRRNVTVTEGGNDTSTSLVDNGTVTVTRLVSTTSKEYVVECSIRPRDASDTQQLTCKLHLSKDQFDMLPNRIGLVNDFKDAWKPVYTRNFQIESYSPEVDAYTIKYHGDQHLQSPIASSILQKNPHFKKVHTHSV
jgi:hypothetical protein